MAQAEIDLDAKKSAQGKRPLLLYLTIGVLALGLGGTITLLIVRSGEQAAAMNAVQVKPALYLPLRPLVVNFSEKGPARFLQVELQVMARDQAVLSAVETHMPAIRNDILFLLGSQTYDTVSTREGKEALRLQILQAIQRILEQNQFVTGVENVYFTSFVMQ
ncbi:MAG: flagellar basal body-associated FliL family protein [Gammaproteobacteria bacterium]|nr:flagellar basal body-associated FliL family protein [Gammaproteobacteria bacterium]